MVILFVCFVALHPKSTAMVMVSSPNHTSFLGKLDQAVNQYLMHILLLVTDNKPSLMIDSAEGRRMTVEIIS